MYDGRTTAIAEFSQMCEDVLCEYNNLRCNAGQAFEDLVGVLDTFMALVCAVTAVILLKELFKVSMLVFFLVSPTLQHTLNVWRA